MGWSVMVFAAGFGTRMKHLTRDRPKPMIEVSGKPLIDHALDLCTALPAERTVVNLHYKAEILAAHLAQRPVTTLHEVPDILDTGGGLRNALPLLGEHPVMTLNSDAIWRGPNPLRLLAQAWDPDRMDGLLMCLTPGQAEGHTGTGDFTADTSGRLSRGDGLVYAGAQIVKTGGLRDIPDRVFSLNRLWDLMIAERRLYALDYPGRWCDVGHPEGIARAETLVAAGDV